MTNIFYCIHYTNYSLIFSLEAANLLLLKPFLGRGRGGSLWQRQFQHKWFKFSKAICNLKQMSHRVADSLGGARPSPTCE